MVLSTTATVIEPLDGTEKVLWVGNSMMLNACAFFSLFTGGQSAAGLRGPQRLDGGQPVELNSRHRFGFRTGFSWVPIRILEFMNVITFPSTFNHIYGDRQHRFELGLGGTLRVATTNQQITVRPSLAQTVAYRYQPLDDIFIVRIAFTPIWFDGFLLWVGFSIGRML